METSIPPIVDLPQTKTNGLALAAGYCGIGSLAMFLIGFVAILFLPIALFFCQAIAVLACLAGIILGIIALIQINNNPGQKGKGMAITGIVIGIFEICVAPVLIISILLILGPTIGNVFSKINSNLAVP
jgi:hypothetical protein